MEKFGLPPLVSSPIKYILFAVYYDKELLLLEKPHLHIQILSPLRLDHFMEFFLK